MVPDVGFVLCSECSTNGQDAWFCATCCRTAILVQHNVGAWAVLGAVLRLFFPPADTDGVDFRVAGVHIDGVHVRLKPGASIKEVCTTPIICVSYVIRCFPKGDCSCSCSMICFTLVCRLQLQLLGCLAPWVGAQAHVHEPTCFASASSRLADEAALHLMLNCKGSSGVIAHCAQTYSMGVWLGRGGHWNEPHSGQRTIMNVAKTDWSQWTGIL